MEKSPENHPNQNEHERKTTFDVTLVKTLDRVSANPLFTFQEEEPENSNDVMVGRELIVANTDDEAHEKRTEYIINPDGTIKWSVDPNSRAGLVLLRGDGTIEQLGDPDKRVGIPLIHSDGTDRWLGEDNSSGIIEKINADDKLFMLAKHMITTMKESNAFEKKYLDFIVEEQDSRIDFVCVEFDEAIEEVSTVASEKVAQKANVSAKEDDAEESQQDVTLDDAKEKVHKSPTQREQDLENRGRRIKNKKNDFTARLDSLSERTVVAAQAEQDAAIKAATGSDKILYSDEEHQAAIDEYRGFKVTDDRKWNRDVYMNPAFIVPPKPTREPIIHTKPTTAPTAHLPKNMPEMPKAAPGSDVNNESSSDVESSYASPETVITPEVQNEVRNDPDAPEKSSEVENEADQPDWKSKLKKSYEKLRDFPRWAAARMGTELMLRNDRHQEKAQKAKPTNSEKEHRQSERKKALGILMGVGAVVLANKLGVEGFDMTGGTLDGLSLVPNSDTPNTTSVDQIVEQIRDAAKDTADQTQEMIDGAVEDVQEMIDDSHDDLPATSTEAPEVSRQVAEFINSTANIVETGGGGEAFMQNHGLNESLWYQYQNEFLQQFPSEAYRMDDGNVGFSRPGELSNDAKRFWATKAGL